MHFSVTSREAKQMSRLRSCRGTQVSLKYLPGDSYRYSVVVSKRLGNSVKRTRAKRIIREIMRLRTENKNGSYLVYVNVPCDTIIRNELTTELYSLIDKVHHSASAPESTP
jgi:ribonuclease P protein component